METTGLPTRDEALALLREYTTKPGLIKHALAVEAARRNLPAARVHLGDAWSALPESARFDLIVSNPPFHRGKGEDFELIDKLVEGAARRLRRRGELLVVAQRRLDLGRRLEDRFSSVEEREPRLVVPAADGVPDLLGRLCELEELRVLRVDHPLGDEEVEVHGLLPELLSHQDHGTPHPRQHERGLARRVHLRPGSELRGLGQATRFGTAGYHGPDAHG